jgi:hypothetical protein
MVESREYFGHLELSIGKIEEMIAHDIRRKRRKEMLRKFSLRALQDC